MQNGIRFSEKTAVGPLRNQNGVISGGLFSQRGLLLTVAASGLGITLTGQ